MRRLLRSVERENDLLDAVGDIRTQFAGSQKEHRRANAPRG
jgi:hypothetical protein